MKSRKLLCLLSAAILIVPAISTAKDTNHDFSTLNDALAAEGMMIGTIEWITSGKSDEMGRTLYFTDRGNKRLSQHFVPNDPRRGGFSDITYLVDRADGATSSGLSADDTQAAIDKAMSTWNGVKCSAIPVTNLGGIEMDVGFVEYVYGFGGYPAWLADLTHAGWLSAGFFDFLAPGGSDFILGVTFTIVWQESGYPTDIDNNDRDDVAFREINYNDKMSWAVDGSDFDVETIALHESGHGLSQAHFGAAFRTKNGKLHFAPRAVMNATYSGVQQKIRKSDNGGHCSNWASWPEK